MTIPSRRRALLIHVEQYRDSRLAPLPAARPTTERLAETLRDGAGVEVTVCSDLTAGALHTTVARFCADRDPDELALVHLACRSAVAPTGELVFAATDTDPDRLVETGLTAARLSGALEDCWAEQKVVLLDCPDPHRPAAVPPPLPAPPGVHLLMSDPAEESAAFAAAVTGALETGIAAGRVVTADDLSDAAAAALRACTPPRAVAVSAVRAPGRMPVVAPPLVGEAGPPGPAYGRVQRTPGWPQLLAYQRDAVLADAGTLPLLDPSGPGHVLLGGQERVLLDAVDDDGCVPLPDGAEELLAALDEDRRRTRTLWAGWPVVVLHGEPGRPAWSAPRCAPLLVRRLEVVPGPGPVRLRPIGPAVPHLGLAHLRLGGEEAAALVSSWAAGWHRGEHPRMVADAERLLRDDLGLRQLEPLQPEALDARLDTRSPLDGASNAAMLFLARPSPEATDLLADLDLIARSPQAIERTALAALLPDAPPEPAAEDVPLITPQGLNAAQRRALVAAMSRRLTAVTGPPGTGKTRLVVDVVATAVTAGQTVLVAARTDRAVEEIVERCRQVLPGLLTRTGHCDGGDAEAGALDQLLARTPTRRTPDTREMGFRYAEHLVRSAEAELRTVAAREAELLALGRARTAAQSRLGHSVEELTARLGPGWGARARVLAATRMGGELRRRRFLGDVALPPGRDRTVETCQALADLDDVTQRWQAAVHAARAAASDAELRAALADAQVRLERASRELLSGAVLDGVQRGRSALAELRSIRRRGAPDRSAFRHVLPNLRGWAITALAAHRLPSRPALFDLVVVDEAQQCPVPEALPLLFRARRALVIGDPAQLPHVGVVPARTDAALRHRHAMSRAWLVRHRLSPIRHSVLAAAERAAGGALTLDEHYRSHPAIASLGSRWGPHRTLHVLTGPGRGRAVGRAVIWRHVAGRAERGPDHASWRNRAEVEEAERCARRLLERLPGAATIGVVSPYRPQVDELARRFAGQPRVAVGTPGAFQGREHDAMVLSLVADAADHRYDRAERQREQWTVAVSRARYLLVVVGDEQVWESRGGVGGALLAAARAAAGAAGRVFDDDLADRLDSALAEVPGAAFEVAVRGHPTDVVLGDGGHRRPVLIDRGVPGDTDPAVHLARMLRRLEALGEAAVRLPGWILHDSEDATRAYIAV